MPITLADKDVYTASKEFEYLEHVIQKDLALEIIDFLNPEIQVFVSCQNVRVGIQTIVVRPWDNLHSILDKYFVKTGISCLAQIRYKGSIILYTEQKTVQSICLESFDHVGLVYSDYDYEISANNC
jgi:hypothetical protein